jgi:hypothetical protein
MFTSVDRQSSRGSEASLDADGIVLLRCGDQSHSAGKLFDLDDTLACDAIVHQLIADAPGYLVVDMRNIVRSSAQARRFTPRHNLRAMAVVTHSMLGRMLLGAFVSIARPRAHVKVFTCPDEAYVWVHRQYIEESLMWRIDGRQTQKNPRLST